MQAKFAPSDANHDNIALHGNHDAKLLKASGRNVADSEFRILGSEARLDSEPERQYLRKKQTRRRPGASLGS